MRNRYNETSEHGYATARGATLAAHYWGKRGYRILAIQTINNGI